ncbi:hypothetical protein AURDEDRAFT_175431 [Auricularia subglabra TFB-10046 SS5]|uniref:MYND-type domain-containing protein n=1 Tax=Auricularia subglabra (strain TFB-10046 / SS5) TaxID=717982 RepID=J0WRX3_AURST|nr:hypothetical protein AURDEDRAFT_175431 [Auricularia subglabra TFB-10046 SS5]
MPAHATHSIVHDLRSHGIDVEQSDVDLGTVRWGETLAAAFHPVLSPSICPGCLAALCNTMEHTTSGLYVLQTKCHAFWDASMAFAAADWTAERRDAASEVLRRTGAQCAKCQAHSCCAAAMRNIVAAESVFDYVFHLVCAYLRLGTIHGIRRDKGFISTRGRWPTSADQLFPYGPERTMTSLIAQLSTHSWAEMVLFSLLSLHRPLAFPPLMLPPNRALVISYLVSRFAACVSEFNDDLAKQGQPILPAARAALALRYIRAYELSAGMFHVVCSGPEHQPDAQQQFCRDHELELFFAFDRMVSLLPRDAIDQARLGWMAYLGTKLWFMLKADARYADRAGPDPPVYVRGVMTLDTLKDPYRALSIYLHSRMANRGCHGPGCGKTVHDKTTPGAFPRCSTCRAVQYCSRECQNTDWRRGAVPHKKVCSILRELSALVSLSPDVSVAEFSAACAKHAFSLEHVDMLISWATDRKCSPNYAGGAEQTPEVHRFILGHPVRVSEPPMEGLVD